MLACFSESASAVAMKVSGAIAKIQFQDIIRQRAEHVKYEQDAIVNLFGQFSIYINERKQFDEAFNLSAIQMFENYVMEDQRKIHFDINKSGSEESKCEYQEAREPKIELF
jgi:methyl-accepting chemotaxis protein